MVDQGIKFDYPCSQVRVRTSRLEKASSLFMHKNIYLCKMTYWENWKVQSYFKDWEYFPGGRGNQKIDPFFSTACIYWMVIEWLLLLIKASHGDCVLIHSLGLWHLMLVINHLINYKGSHNKKHLKSFAEWEISLCIPWSCVYHDHVNTMRSLVPFWVWTEMSFTLLKGLDVHKPNSLKLFFLAAFLDTINVLVLVNEDLHFHWAFIYSFFYWQITFYLTLFNTLIQH